MEDRSRTVVEHGAGISGLKGYPTLNASLDVPNGIYYCKVNLGADNEELGLMSVIDKYAEIHMLYAPNRDYYGDSIKIDSIKEINKDLIINAVMHLYGGEIVKRLGVENE
tara:strand:- start:39 stop:368 length:330 start_codon:yes stop_codon:yes gene_type:complete